VSSHRKTTNVVPSSRRRLTIVGGGRDAWVVRRRGRWKTVCAGGTCRATVPGPSTSPLDGRCEVVALIFRCREHHDKDSQGVL